MEHPVKHIIEPSEISDSEVSSLCGSELELEMAWGEGPIAPLRTETPAVDGAAKNNKIAGVERSSSSGSGSSRARTPQKRGNESPLARSKRLINIHPIRSAGYLSKPNELPVGVRKQQRWFNDHHIGNRMASTRLEDLMEHMTINVEWRSKFQKLAEPQNENLQKEFRQGGSVLENSRYHAPRNRRKDEWNDAEQMFTRIDRRARTLMLRSFNSFAVFIEAVEYVVSHFIQWQEVPSELEIATPLFRMLKHPVELMNASENDVRMILPLLDSAFHRLIIHTVCQFYGVRSRTEANRRLNTKIMVLKHPKKKSSADDLVQISLCEFIRETRMRRQVAAVSPEVMGSSHALELQSKNSECSEGFCLVEALQEGNLILHESDSKHVERSTTRPAAHEHALYMDQSAPQEVLTNNMPLEVPEKVSCDKVLLNHEGVTGKDTSDSEQHQVKHNIGGVEGKAIVLTKGVSDGESLPFGENAGQVKKDENKGNAQDVADEESEDSKDETNRTIETTDEELSDIMDKAEEKLEQVPAADADVRTLDAANESDPKTTKDRVGVSLEGELTTNETEEPNTDKGVEWSEDWLEKDASMRADKPTEVNVVAVGNEALTTFNTSQLSPAIESASPVAIPDLLIASAEDESIEDSTGPSALEIHESEGQLENGEKSQEREHAIITAVTDSAEKAAPVDANMEVVLEKIRKKFKCESVEVLASGEVLALPVGWSTRRSKSNDGKTYYVSPYGHTQWLRPPMKTGVIYNWVHEIEVTFGPGRLGLNLKQIAGIPGTEFTDLQVHIAEIYKLPNGMASPAEIYNWSVKPEKRLALNMRVTMMNGISLTGYTYSEVLELLARLVRPVHIKFADISKGIVGRVEPEGPHEETEEVKEARAARVMQTSLRMEYFQILVSSELHKQVWAAMKHRMDLKHLEMQKKCTILETHVEREELYQNSLQTEREKLIQEEASLKELIAKLDKQLVGEIESPEVIRAAQLVERTAELEKEVTEIIAENEELQALRVETEETLDSIQKELDEYRDLEADLNGQQDIKFFSPAFLGSMVQRGSIDIRAEDARERLLAKIKAQRDHLEEEVKMEEERTLFVESEIYQFRSQMDVAAAAVKREDAFISGERPPQLIFLENKIALLKKNLKETVSGLATATSSGDQQQAGNLSLRRASLKDDLAAALEEMRRMENELQVFFDADEGKQVGLPIVDSSVDAIDIDVAPHERESELLRLHNKLTKLQTRLHETVVELAKAAGENDEVRKSDLGTRRLALKDEMKVVQDELEAITNGTPYDAVQTKEVPRRSSIVSSPLPQETPRRSTCGSRASLSDAIRNSIGGRASLVSVRAFQSSNRPSTSVQRDLERLDSSGSHQSNSSASMGQLHDSNSNQLPRDGSLPTMSGILRKHPTHSNEKGAFGNMSLRGVRERWCNIEPDGYLRYYKREGDREPRGAILLKHKSLEILHGKGVSKPNEFVICSPTNQTRMIAKSHDEMLKWVKVLQLAHAYFMQHSTESGHNTAHHQENGVTSPNSADAELAYRNKRATLGF